MKFGTAAKRCNLNSLHFVVATALQWLFALPQGQAVASNVSKAPLLARARCPSGHGLPMRFLDARMPGPQAARVLKHCQDGQQHGYPVFNSPAELKADPWGKYFTAIYGEVPGSGYPICTYQFSLIYNAVASQAGVKLPEIRNECPDEPGMRYKHMSSLNPSAAYSWIYHRDLAHPVSQSWGLPNNTWVEVTHTDSSANGGNEDATWYYYAPGSGIYAWLGRSRAYDDHTDAVTSLLGAPCWDGYQCELQHAMLYQAMINAGIDTLQFLHHDDMKCSSGGQGNMAIEILSPLSPNCGVGSTKGRYRAGWEAKAECECNYIDFHGKMIAGCKGYGLDAPCVAFNATEESNAHSKKHNNAEAFKVPLPMWSMWSLLCVICWGVAGFLSSLSEDRIGSEHAFIWHIIGLVAFGVLVLCLVCENVMIQPFSIAMSITGGFGYAAGTIWMIVASRGSVSPGLVVTLISLHPLVVLVLNWEVLRVPLNPIRALGAVIVSVATIPLGNLTWESLPGVKWMVYCALSLIAHCLWLFTTEIMSAGGTSVIEPCLIWQIVGASIACILYYLIRRARRIRQASKPRWYMLLQSEESTFMESYMRTRSKLFHYVARRPSSQSRFSYYDQLHAQTDTIGVVYAVGMGIAMAAGCHARMRALYASLLVSGSDMLTSVVMITSLYPLISLLLSRLILREQLLSTQFNGIALAILGTILLFSG